MSANSKDVFNVRCSLFLVGVLFILTGCASKPPSKPEAVSPEPALEQRTIYNISVSEDDENTVVIIKGNQSLMYTAVKHKFPLGVALYFRDTALKGIQKSYTPDSTLIKRIEASELKREKPSSRIEILLNEDVPYEVTRDNHRVSLRFTKPVVEPKGPKEQEKQQEQQEQQPEGTGEISQDAEPKEQEEPVPEPTLAAEVKPEPIISVEAKPEEAIETKQEPEPAVAAEVKPEPTVEAPIEAKKIEKIEKTDKKPAWVNRIDFEMMGGGKSRVIIGATRKFQCETEKASEKRLLLKLLDARIPQFQKRPLITTRFNSAVDRILPIQSPKMGDTAVIAIELREAVPYRVEQKENTCVVDFEASSVPPRPELEAKAPEWVQAMNEAEVAVVKEAQEAEAKAEKLPEELVVTETGTTYTGQKISLTFQDADIHSVFRILHDVSGKNFVIGDDVKGNVTLKLDNVPWDQVLDLILKMNKLSTVVEGNVIRIAKLDTLAGEQKALEEKLKAEQQVEEQEPMVTDYIAINYSEAKTIKAHMDEIKTPRGKVTCDERTNTIIIKDVEAAIQRARELAKRLDRVTPQVMIEARIVEASTDFSREIGVQWGGTYGIQPGDDRYGIGPQRGYDTLGGTYGIHGEIGNNWVVDLPAQKATSGIGFDFARLAGLTPLTLQANLTAMEQQGKGRIISSPRILTMDNKEAYIQQGVDIPYQVREESGSFSLKWAKAVLELEVTPHITMDRRIAMKIVAKKDSPDYSIVVQGAPAINKKEAGTELLVNNGDTIVIGGIITKTEAVSKKGVPWLCKIPVLGWLFRTESKGTEKRELLIFVTPTIVELEETQMIAEARL